MFFLNQAVITSVSVDDASDAAGLVNAMRNLGGRFALAALSTLQDQGEWLHMRRIEETLRANSVAVQDYVHSTGQMLGGETTAMRVLSQQIIQQSLVMTYNDILWLFTVIT